MVKTKLEGFKMVGVSVRTSNEDGKAAKDIPALWAEFQQNEDLQSISNKSSDEVVCAYTRYESDHNAPYTVVLGYKVSSFDKVNPNFEQLKVNSGDFDRYEAKGDLIGGAVIQTWYKIWEESGPRTYEVDFELYGEAAQNPRDGACDIYIGIK